MNNEAPASADTDINTEEIIAKYDKESNVRKFSGIRAYIVTGFLLIFAAFVYKVTLISNLPEQMRRWTIQE